MPELTGTNRLHRLDPHGPALKNAKGPMQFFLKSDESRTGPQLQIADDTYVSGTDDLVVTGGAKHPIPSPALFLAGFFFFFFFSLLILSC